GYMGRTAAFELLDMTEPIREHIAGGANLTQIKAAARKNKMLYLQEQALALVMQGVTSVQEVIRVSQPKNTKQR
ncbi:MAG: type II secretion system protein GspE, partial [Planctomycetes bacterium]|nr:type II secretion system protein GspE [Planctomycetota bacterium]